MFSHPQALFWTPDTHPPRLSIAGGHPPCRRNLRCIYGPIAYSPATRQAFLLSRLGEACLHQKLKGHQKVRRRSIGPLGLAPLPVFRHRACCLHLVSKWLFSLYNSNSSPHLFVGQLPPLGPPAVEPRHQADTGTHEPPVRSGYQDSLHGTSVEPFEDRLKWSSGPTPSPLPLCT